MVRAHQARPIGKFIRFSVLLPFVSTREGLSILFETRSEKVSQPGDTSFPGGRIEAGETAEQAAIRETVEEIGILEENIEIFGRWNSLYHYSNMLIETFIGELHDFKPGRFVPNDEVSQLFFVPLSFFLENAPSEYQSKLHVRLPDDFPYALLPNEKDYPFRMGMQTTYFWQYQGHIIWGLTAQIVKDFIEHL